MTHLGIKGERTFTRLIPFQELKTWQTVENYKFSGCNLPPKRVSTEPKPDLSLDKSLLPGLVKGVLPVGLGFDGPTSLFLTVKGPNTELHEQRFLPTPVLTYEKDLIRHSREYYSSSINCKGPESGKEKREGTTSFIFHQESVPGTQTPLGRELESGRESYRGVTGVSRTRDNHIKRVITNKTSLLQDTIRTT